MGVGEPLRMGVDEQCEQRAEPPVKKKNKNEFWGFHLHSFWKGKPNSSLQLTLNLIKYQIYNNNSRLKLLFLYSKSLQGFCSEGGVYLLVFCPLTSHSYTTIRILNTNFGLSPKMQNFYVSEGDCWDNLQGTETIE